MDTYQAKAKRAKDAIARKGGRCKIKGFVLQPNPEQPNRPGDRVEYEFDVMAVFLDYETKQIDGTNILTGDQYCLVSPLEAAIPKGISATITRANGDTFSIKNIENLMPGDVSLLYTIQVRR